MTAGVPVTTSSSQVGPCQAFQAMVTSTVTAMDQCWPEQEGSRAERRSHCLAALKGGRGSGSAAAH
jgi:hypothetical protein